MKVNSYQPALQRYLEGPRGVVDNAFDSRARGSRVRYPVRSHTFVSPSAESTRAVVSYWRKYVHEVLVNCLGSLSLSRNSVVRLSDRPDMKIAVYRERKTTTQQEQIQKFLDTFIESRILGVSNFCV